MKKKPQGKMEAEEAQTEPDPAIEALAKVAFGNMFDFARFNPDGSVEIFDWEKAREVGADVSVVTRIVGRGKNARVAREVNIKMPNKLPALLKLLKLVDPPQRQRSAR